MSFGWHAGPEDGYCMLRKLPKILLKEQLSKLYALMLL